ncbi:uncharacterized protein K02A2.6 [Trichonephila clavata]|uniref:Uncharacterized protein K02A2.6 n=1 Tax=Trichonephila clavata TaxID=2740835 RepID=A0A8X6JC03_TRICU|nr:uncharacterized protein K02A2.6 [Trichonephila clavata]
MAMAMENAFKGANDIMGRGINSMQNFKKRMNKESNFTKTRKKALYCSRYTGTNHVKENIYAKKGVKDKTNATFKPSINGQAECYVATLKHSLRIIQKYEGTIQQKLSTFLLQYRKAPIATTPHSPSMLFLKRDIRNRIDLLLPHLKTKIQNKLRKANFEFRDRKFDIGDRVVVRVYRAANIRWKFGTILNQDDVLQHMIDVQGSLVRRYVDQIRPVGDQV